jgi:riboflavin kinase/FMN adenylyltransferase
VNIIRHLTGSEIARPTVLTWGIFDGVHCGHQKILQTVVERARALQVTPTVITHDPHPRAVFRPEVSLPLLQTFEQRMEGLRRLGIEQTIVIQFTREYAKTTAEQFLREIVFGQLDAREVYLGQGARFGHKQQGDIGLVMQMAQELGRIGAEVDEVRLHHRRIQSTTIRRLLSVGHLHVARKMLGQPHEMVGTVIKGRGRGFLFPIANLQVENDLIPARGVYITLALIEGHWRPSTTHIGIGPTFGGDAEVSVACHILDSHQNVLGRRIRLRFLRRLRNEKQSSGIEQQIDRDMQRTRLYFDRLRVKISLEPERFKNIVNKRFIELAVPAGPVETRAGLLVSSEYGNAPM